MRLPAIPPAEHLELGAVIFEGEPAYISPPFGSSSRDATNLAALYALALQAAVQDLEDGPMNEMSDSQYAVAKWVRDYVMNEAERKLKLWQSDGGTAA